MYRRPFQAAGRPTSNRTSGWIKPRTRQYSGASLDAGTTVAVLMENSKPVSATSVLHAARGFTRVESASAEGVHSRNCELFCASAGGSVAPIVAANVAAVIVRHHVIPPPRARV